MQDADLTWWQSEVPDILKEGRFPRFIQADITRHTGLEPDFDLVHCNRVLCHILGGDQSESSSPDVEGLKSAIEEMARLVKSGGWVLAVEPQIQGYEYLFKDAGLEQVARFEEDDGKVRYLYTRP
jgi:SAM-dependent methyltransferase